MIYFIVSFIAFNIVRFVPVNAKSLVQPKSIGKLPTGIQLKLFSNVAAIRETPEWTKSSTVLNVSPITKMSKETEIKYNQSDNRLSFAIHATQTQDEPSATSSGFLRKLFPQFQWHQVPNYLTYCRCVAVPILIWCFHLPDKNAATCIIFAMASLTDYLDGFLARKWNVSSDFGAFLDPVVCIRRTRFIIAAAVYLLFAVFHSLGLTIFHIP
jgi:hypothetical protein